MRFLVLLLLITPTLAFGYNDPGTGHYLWQTVMTALFGGLLWLKSVAAFLMKPKQWLMKASARSPKRTQNEPLVGN